MIESFNGLYKWELIYPHGPWQGIEDVDWFNQRRRHGEILPGRRRFTTPAAHEAAYYRQTSTAPEAVTQQTESLQNPGCFYVCQAISNSLQSRLACRVLGRGRVIRVSTNGGAGMCCEVDDRPQRSRRGDDQPLQPCGRSDISEVLQAPWAPQVAGPQGLSTPK